MLDIKRIMLFNTRKLIILLCALLWSSLATAGFDEAMAAYRKGDFQASLKEFQELAKQGDAKAQYRLGVMYYEGKGAPRNYNVAAEWYGKAAKQGSADAQLRLGFMYDKGQGIQQDHKVAVEWYLKAAEQGSAIAQRNLGVAYRDGEGVPQDDLQELKWFYIAAASGDKGVIEGRDSLASKMNINQIEEAWRLAREWSSQHTKGAPGMAAYAEKVFREPEMIAIPGKNYEMGKYEVTQAEWEALMFYNPSRFKGENLPVETVNWDGVQEYLRRLNQKTGKNYRLPTEDEWVNSCYGGKKTKYCGGDNFDAVAWHGSEKISWIYFWRNKDNSNSGGITHPVGQKQANGYGLYDMSGNVIELTGKAPVLSREYKYNIPEAGTELVELGLMCGSSWSNVFSSDPACFTERMGDSSFGFRNSFGFRLARMLHSEAAVAAATHSEAAVAAAPQQQKSYFTRYYADFFRTSEGKQFFSGFIFIIIMVVVNIVGPTLGRREVEHPDFKTQRLTVEPAGLFSGPRLLVNGAVVKKEKGLHNVTSDSGTETTIQLKSNYIDPIPKVKIGDEVTEIAKPLKWYVPVALFLIPIFAFSGASIGFVLGIVLAAVFGRISQSNLSGLPKFALKMIMFIGAVIVALLVKLAT